MFQIIAISVVLFFLTCLIPRLSMKLPENRFSHTVWLIFLVYLIGNMYFTLLSRVPGSGRILEFTPFKTNNHLFQNTSNDTQNVRGIVRFLLEGTSPMSVLVLNIFLYYPMGYLLAVLFPKFNSKKIILIGCCASIATEIIQYIGEMGWCDINDIIYNTLGTAIGVAVCIFQRKRC